MTVIPNGFASVTISLDMADDSGLLQTTLAYPLALGSSQADFQATLGEVFEAWDTNMLPQTYGNVSLIGVSGTARLDDGTLVSGETARTPEPGRLAGLAAPSGLSAILTKRTARAGPDARGRMFAPGLISDEDIQQGTQILVTRVAALQLAVDAFDAEMATQLNFPHLLHTDPTTPPDPITRFLPRTTVGFIRSRADTG